MGKGNKFPAQGHAPTWPANPGLIETELATILIARQMSKFEIPQTFNLVLENRVRAIADRVARSTNTGSFQYSNYHSWEALRNVKTAAAARASAQHGSWSRMAPYGNCLAMADTVYAELRKRLLEDSRLLGYVDRVQLATNNWRQAATSDRDYHVLAIMRFTNFCIVIDPVFCRRAQVVPAGSIGGIAQGTQFCYARGPGGARILVGYNSDVAPSLDHPQTSLLVWPFTFDYSDPYMDIKGGVAGGVARLSHPSSKHVYPYEHGHFPSRRHTVGLDIWRYQPLPTSTLNWIQLPGGRFLIEDAVILEVDFEDRLIIVFVPGRDWLNRPANHSVISRIGNVFGIFALPPTLANVDKNEFRIYLGEFDDVVRDGYHAETWRKLQLVDDIFQRLNQPQGEILGVAHVMLEVYKAAATQRRRRLANERRRRRGRS